MASLTEQAKTMVFSMKGSSATFVGLNVNPDGSWTARYVERGIDGMRPGSIKLYLPAGQSSFTTIAPKTGARKLSSGGSDTREKSEQIQAQQAAQSQEQQDAARREAISGALTGLNTYLSAAYGSGTGAPDRAGLESAINNAWRAMSRAGIDSVTRTNEINRVLKSYDTSENLANKGSVPGQIGSVDGTDNDIRNMFGLTGSAVEDDFTDPYQVWAPGMNGLFYGDLSEDAADSPFDNGGFGGFSGPTYQKPDERVVRESVDNYLKLVVGQTDDLRARDLTALFMSEHRRNFDTAGEEIDPWQSVKERARNFGDYQNLHANRPSDKDETQWLNVAIQGQRQQDVGEDAAVERGKVAAKLGDLSQDAAAFQTQIGTQINRGFFARAAKSASLLGNAVK